MILLSYLDIRTFLSQSINPLSPVGIRFPIEKDSRSVTNPFIIKIHHPIYIYIFNLFRETHLVRQGGVIFFGPLETTPYVVVVSGRVAVIVVQHFCGGFVVPISGRRGGRGGLTHKRC